MAIAIDASSPAVANGTGSGSTITSASFTPPASCWLITVAVAGWGGVPTVVMSDSQSGTWSSVVTANTNTAANGGVYIQKRRVTTSVAMTVTATFTNLGGGKMLGVYVVTGADATTPIGATTGGEISSSTNFTKSLTTTTTGSLVLGGANNAANNSTFSLASNTAWPPMSGTDPVANGTDFVAYAVFKGSSLTGTPGALSHGVTSSGSDNGHVALAEIVGSGSSTVNGTDGTSNIVDTAIVQANVPVADTGAGVDTATVTAPVNAADTSTGADVATLKNSGAADTGTWDEAVRVLSGGSTLVFASDTATSTEGVAPLVIKDGDTFTAAELFQTAYLGIQGPLPPGPRIVRIGQSSTTS